jgi:hypothetical protein
MAAGTAMLCRVRTERPIRLLEGPVDEVKPPDLDEDAYLLQANQELEIPARWQTVASYVLELPAKCPHCRNPIRTLKVLRLVRSKVPFTSTLPRGGRAIVCPQCEAIISVEASGLL